MGRTFVLLGSCFGFLGVAAGAFGAHMLRERLTDVQLSTWQTGVLYHLVHAVALFLVGVWLQVSSTRAAAVAGWLFFIGILIFSGSLYALALSGIGALGAITPVGGVAFLSGWLALAFSSTGTPPPSIKSSD